MRQSDDIMTSLTDSEIVYHHGAVIGLVYVTGCRPLVPADKQAACFYAPGLFAWTLEHARRFKTPIVMRGPQKIVYLDRNRVEEALGND